MNKKKTPMQRARAKKRAAGLLPFEAWVHGSNLDKLKTVIKHWQAGQHMIMDVYPNLTPEQRRFERLLSLYPVLYSCWNFDTRDCDTDRLNDVMGALSGGEQVMASFFIAVWTGNTDAPFSIVDAGALEDEHRRVIADWLLDPFYPYSPTD